MGKPLEKIAERIKSALVNPELDKVRAEVRAALEEMKKNPENSDVTASLLERGIKGLRGDLKELGISPDRWPGYEAAYEKRFRVATTNLEKEAMLASPEALQLDAFVNDFAKYTKLNDVIAECKAKDSKDPIKKMIQIARLSTPLLAGLGVSLAKWLNEGKKDEEKTKPSKLEKAAAKADEVLKKGERKKKGAIKKPETEPEEALSGVGVYTAEARRLYEKNPTYEGTVTEIESLGSVKYEINPEHSAKKMNSKEFKATYKSIKSRQQRNMFALQQVAAGNATNAFERLKMTGKTGMAVEMEVDRSAVRVAGTDVQFDGPTAMAAAQISGCTLPTPWISEQIYNQALKNKGVVEFVAAPAIAKALGIKWDNDNPDGNKMMSAEFALKRDELLKKYRQDHDINDNRITAGYFKDIVHPVPGVTKKGRLEIFGGKDPTGGTIQGLSGGAHILSYSDYSHGLRRVKNTVKVKEGEETKEMPIGEFYSNKKYAQEFGFNAQELGQAYAYTPKLQQFVDENKPKGAA